MSNLTYKVLLSSLLIIFSLSGCGASGGSEGDEPSATPTNDVPTVNLISDTYSIDTNSNVTLTWSSKFADECTASGTWDGIKGITGTETIGPLTEDVTFTLSCTGTNGVSVDSVNINVNSTSLPVPTLSLQASSDMVNYNGSTVLSWSSTNATACFASGDWTGTKSITGTQTIDFLTANSTFVLSCSGEGGTANYSVDINVLPPALPTVSLSASESTVLSNGSTILTWSSTDATSCLASGDWSGDKAVSGSQTVSSILVDSNFNLSCTGPGGTVNSSINVSVVVSNSGTALLSWSPPTNNTDDTELTDLTGYKIYYGTTSGNYANTITVNNAGLSSYLVESLSANTWYFTMTSFNASNIESARSLEVSKVIN